MKIHIVTSVEGRLKECDALILPFSLNRTPLFDIDQFASSPIFQACQLLNQVGSFQGKEDEVVIQYVDSVCEKRIVFLGLGSCLDQDRFFEAVRSGYAKAIQLLLREEGVQRISTCVPSSSEKEGNTFSSHQSQRIFRSLFEGIGFGAYKFQKYIGTQPLSSIQEVCCIAHDYEIGICEAEIASVTIEAARIVRDLVNSSAHEVTPDSVTKSAESLRSFSGIEVQTHDLAWIRTQKMGLIEAVGRGAEHEPKFVIIDWNHSKSDRTVFIGKGVTFDSGGLNMKPTGAIETMRCDMAGAASLIGLMHAVASLKLPIWITAILPLVENAVSAHSMRPGDVYCSRKGTTIEIANTDAEGRLILADALNYAVTELNPARIVDVATLTGASEIALGSDVSALFSNSNILVSELEKASQQSGEPLWRLPLHKKYVANLKSDYADMKNVTGNRAGGAITAALFLEHFVENIPWAHLDIAGPAYSKEGRGIYGKGASSIPFRTLLEFCLPRAGISR